MPRDERQKNRRKILRQILNQTDDVKTQEELYNQQTGAKRPDFYRRKGEILTAEFDDYDAA
jgi:hypothetical protein